jgi:hypothetical protein
MDFPILSERYDSAGKFLEEPFEIQSVSVSAVVNFVEKSDDNLVFWVKAQGGGGEQNVSNISSSLTRIGVKRENCVDFGDVVGWEDRIFWSDVLGEDGFEILLCDLFLWHEISLL